MAYNHGRESTTDHKEIILGYDYNNIRAMISGKYKLIIGSQGRKNCDYLMWSPLNDPFSDGLKGDFDLYYLYDIVNDPGGEHEDLTKKEPSILKQLLSQYNAYSKEPRDMQDQGYHNDSPILTYEVACQYMAKNGGYWRPWKNE